MNFLVTGILSNSQHICSEFVGASRGIGLGYVKHLLRNPTINKVIATCRNPATCNELQSLKTQHDAKLILLALDTTAEAQYDTVVNDLKQFGVESIDVLIANAAIASATAPSETFLTISPSDMTNIYNTNVIGTMFTLQKFMKMSLASKVKLVVVMSTAFGSISALSESKFPSWESYKISKAATNMLAMSYAVDPAVRAAKSKVVCMCPGWVQTDMGNTGGFTGAFTVDESVTGILSVLQCASDLQMGNNDTTATQHHKEFAEKFAKEDCVFVNHKGVLMSW